MKRATSIFLPTVTYPMFPEKLAMEGMSLRQGELCNAVTVSIVLHSDGRYAVELLVSLNYPLKSTCYVSTITALLYYQYLATGTAYCSRSSMMLLLLSLIYVLA